MDRGTATVGYGAVTSNEYGCGRYIDMSKHDNQTNERSLNWMLVVMGTMILLSSAFFLYREISLSTYYNVFFTATAVIGAVLVAAGIIAANMKTSWQPRKEQMSAVRSDE